MVSDFRSGSVKGGPNVLRTTGKSYVESREWGTSESERPFKNLALFIHSPSKRQPSVGVFSHSLLKVILITRHLLPKTVIL